MTIVVNGRLLEFPDGVTVSEVFARLGNQVGTSTGAVAVEVNREVVPRGEHATRVLREGDKVEVVHFVGGG